MGDFEIAECVVYFSSNRVKAGILAFVQKYKVDSC